MGSNSTNIKNIKLPNDTSATVYEMNPDEWDGMVKKSFKDSKGAPGQKKFRQKSNYTKPKKRR
jgi:hypothetical protein